MEVDPTNIDKQLLWRSYDQDSSHGRSYTCTFCKRGFSNAQALGGHMNIHRRDRAKLKQSSTTHEDLVLSSMDTRETDDHTDSFNYSSQSEACQDQSYNPKRRASIFSRDGHGDCRRKNGTQKLRQLSLFEERPSGYDYPMMSNFGSERGENRMQSGYGSSRAELDLELRL